MKLKLQDKGSVDVADAAFGADYNEAARAPGRNRVSRGRPCRNQGAEESRGGSWRWCEALASERHRPRACRYDPQPDLGWRWSYLCCASHAATTRKSTRRCTVLRCARCCLSWFARIAWSSSMSLTLEAPKTRLLATKLKELGSRQRPDSERGVRREAVPGSTQPAERRYLRRRRRWIRLY